MTVEIDVKVEEETEYEKSIGREQSASVVS